MTEDDHAMAQVVEPQEVGAAARREPHRWALVVLKQQFPDVSIVLKKKGFWKSLS